MYCQLLIRGTELTVTWPQPWWPLHAPKSLWKWLKQATQFPHLPQPCEAKVGRHMQKRVIWKKNAALVTCSSLCACSHVTIHSPIKSTPLHVLGATWPVPIVKGIQSGWCGSGFGSFWWGIPCLWVTLCFCLTPAVTKVKPFIFSKEWRRCCTTLPVHLQQSFKHHRPRF